MFPASVPQRLQQAYLFASHGALGDKVTLAGYGPPRRGNASHPAERVSTFKWNDAQGILSFVNSISACRGGVSMLMARPHGDAFHWLQPKDIKDSQWLCLRFDGDPTVIREKWKGYPDPNIRVAFRGGMFCAWKLKAPLVSESLFALGQKMAEQWGARPTNFIPLPGVRMPDGDEPSLRCFIKGDGVPLSTFGIGPQVNGTEETFQTADQLSVPPMSWLWPGFLPCANLALLMGEPGVGKSQMAMDIAARITRGAEWPDGTAGGKPGGVVFIETEDSLGDTLARADAADADRARMIISSDALDLSTPDGIADLERKISGLANVKTVVLSPFGMFFGEIGSYKDTDIRRLMVPLLAWAEKKNIAIMGVMHKGAGSKGRSAEDAAGPQAFGRRARVLLSALIDQTDPIFKANPKRARRLLVSAKANNARDDMELPYKIVSAKQASRIDWLERDRTEDGHDLDTPVMDAGNVTPMRRQRPEDWLRDRLKQGEAPASTIEEEAKQIGIPRSTLYRIKDKVGVESQKGGFGAAAVWRLVR